MLQALLMVWRLLLGIYLYVLPLFSCLAPDSLQTSYRSIIGPWRAEKLGLGRWWGEQSQEGNPPVSGRPDDLPSPP